MRILMPTTDAFGGHGGLAKYNRDFMKAVCLHPSVRELVAIPRIAEGALEPMPDNLTYSLEGLGGKGRYLAAMARGFARRGAIDLVICGHVNLLPTALLGAWRYRAPLILCVYGIDVWTAPSSQASAYACRYIDAVVSISRITAERFRSWAPLKGKRDWILPNAVELDKFQPGPKDPDLLDRYGLRERTVLATLARLDAHERMKGVDELLDVLPRLIARHPRLTYLVMGDGSDRERLEDKARGLGISASVVFAGRIDEREKVRHYRLADLFAMPSRGEGFGFVFLEALACGVPVVASSLDGGREAVREGALGVLVDPRSPDDVVRGIEEGLTLPRGVVPSGLSYFSFENFIGRTHAFLEEFVNGSGT